ncbi:PAS domain-containing hybrid sensor histidine kinase/response regulator [Pseudoalteromonas spongiae]|uniref:PAS domain-containing hybrid sensor histidine kinase/response regulator n=1 Tax=Pseudoalteromonas spongiae TaxID=298657 RepID=UPI00110BDC35|nr:PAS domain S-box protein [Pseudoalteromonas spongiae]TMO83094.1 PAS domain-containing sensor histidine kinase [Pseudoalteromonas spongiae]
MAANNSKLESENKALKHKLQQLSAEHDKYKKLFEVSGDALSIIDSETGKFVECNQSAVEMHGVQSKDNFNNLRPSDLSPEYQPCGKRSDEMAVEYLTKVMTEGPQLFQWTHSRLDGSTFPCLVSLTALSIGTSKLILAIGRDISELVKTQEALNHASTQTKEFELAYLDEKEKFEKFVNLAPVGIAINSIESGGFEFVNEAFSDITGYSIGELNEMNFWQLTPQKYEDQEFIQLESLHKTGHYGPYLKEYIHKSGDSYPVLLSGLKITDNKGKTSIWSVVQDMSKQKEIEEQIQDAKNKADYLAVRLQLANDSAGIGVWEWDLVSGELIWDKWMYKLYGISKSEFPDLYQAWVYCVHPDDIEEAKSKLESAIKGCEVNESEFRVVHPNGTIRNLKASAEVLRNKSGKAVKVIGVNYDITEKTNAMQLLSNAKEVAESAAKAKSDFLSNMSHEIRTPMNAILGGLQLLKDTKLTPDLKQVLNNASFSAQSLLTIINDILDYSKIESNNLELEQAEFSLTEVLESIKYDLDGLVSTKRINFLVVKGESFVDYWLGDLVRVKQIILNLASNAVKFTDVGSVNIYVSSQDLNDIKTLCIAVSDSGIGMSEEAVASIFDRFTQADTSTTRKYGGTGLGMSITLSLIKMMGGEITIVSKEGNGTKVNVMLPLKPLDMVKKPKIQRSLSAPNLANKKILIAEDNAINKVLIETMLKPTKAKLTIVDNGQLAIGAVGKDTFDLVLMDIHMPVMDGIEAQQRINSLYANLPVIALTANVMKQDVDEYLAQGFVSHIPKPININNLYGTLKHFL